MCYRGDFRDADNIAPVAHLLSSPAGAKIYACPSVATLLDFQRQRRGINPRPGEKTAESSSLQEREKITAQLFMAKRKWPETLH
jgi:hypothetical protein